MSLYEFFIYIYKIIRINSLEFEVFEDKLTEKYQIITKTINTARLQIVNSVDITQDIWDKIFNLYNITIDYGFASGGYRFSFYYITEETAQKISDLIKPRGRVKGVEVR